MSGRCKDRPELVDKPLPLSVRLDVLPVRGGEGFLHRIFEPLGYSVEAVRYTWMRSLRSGATARITLSPSAAPKHWLNYLRTCMC